MVGLEQQKVNIQNNQFVKNYKFSLYHHFKGWDTVNLLF